MTRIYLSSRSAAFQQKACREDPMLGHSRSSHTDVIAAGGSQAAYEPGVDNLVVSPRHNAPKRQHLAIGLRHRGAQNHPLRMNHATGELPLPSQPVAARYPLHLAVLGVKRTRQ